MKLVLHAVQPTIPLVVLHKVQFMGQERQFLDIGSKYYPFGQEVHVFVTVLYLVFSAHSLLQTPFPSEVGSKKYPVLHAVH